MVLEPSQCSLSLSNSYSNTQFEIQSSELFEMSSVEQSVVSTVTTTFNDENTGICGSIPRNSATNLADQQGQIELANYLSRPVLIKTHTWAQTDSYVTTTAWYPWYEFFNSSSIKNKINNYGLISCNLHLKFVVNASPFYSGAMAFCYTPLNGWRGTSIITDTGGGELLGYSQQPKTWIFPQTNQGGEMILPFFLHKNWLDITSASELQNMGAITPALFAALVSANGVTGQSILVNVYAWAEDVHLHAPTMKLAVQSDEYEIKPSQIASAVSASAKSLSSLPVIGPYMKATSYVAGKIASVAAMFGYTNVPNISTVHYQKNSAYPNFASPEISVPIDKLSVDPKAETTLDPRTVGLDGVDELSINYIAGRESFLGTAILSSTDAVDALTLVSRVTPDLLYLAGSNKPIQFTPMAYCSTMFGSWRGDIVFRFKFVCTQFHKGRVRISFDPISDISIASPDYTSVFNEVVDIGADNDVEVTVPYMQAITYLKTDSVTGNYNFSGAALAPNSKCNGLITMRVVNPLSGPIAPVAIPVMIFVRGGDNLEFAYPDAPSVIANTYTPYTVQASDLYYKPEGTKVIAGNSCGLADPNRNLVHYGETIKSFRPLLHRSMYVDTVAFAASDGSMGALSMSLYSNRQPNFPGYDTNGFSRALGTVVPASTFNYNFSRMNIHQMVALLFVGQRGSVNWTYNVGSNNATPYSSVSAKRYLGTISRTSYRQLLSSGSSNAYVKEGAIAAYWGEPNSGIALTDQRTQAAVSANFPFYSRYNMQFVRPATTTLGSSNDDTDTDNVVLQVNTGPASTTVYPLVQRFFSYGPDYNFFCFLNTPSLYYIAVPAGSAA